MHALFYIIILIFLNKNDHLLMLCKIHQVKLLSTNLSKIYVYEYNKSTEK
jgi:hypothetical protein